MAPRGVVGISDELWPTNWIVQTPRVKIIGGGVFDGDVNIHSSPLPNRVPARPPPRPRTIMPKKDCGETGCSGRRRAGRFLVQESIDLSRDPVHLIQIILRCRLVLAVRVALQDFKDVAVSE